MLFACLLALFVAVVRSQSCADSIKNIAYVANDKANYMARCNACQNTKPPGDTCEYCFGMCLSEKLYGEGNPLQCFRKRGEPAKRDAGCDMINQFNQTYRDNTLPPEEYTKDTTTLKCLNSDKVMCDKDGNAVTITASHIDMTFPSETTAPLTTSNVGGSSGQSNNNQVTVPTVKGGTTAAPGGTGPGALCATTPTKKYYDRCGKCGGDGKSCTGDASTIVLSFAIVLSLVASMLL